MSRPTGLVLQRSHSDIVIDGPDSPIYIAKGRQALPPFIQKTNILFNL